jgi:hypothetical protein
MLVPICSREDSSHPQDIDGPDRLLLEGVKTMLKLSALAVAVIAALSFSAAYAGESGTVSLKASPHVIGVMQNVTIVSAGKDYTAGPATQERASIEDNSSRAVEGPSIIGRLLPLLASLWLLLPVMAGACPLESDTADTPAARPQDRATAPHAAMDSSQTSSCRDFRAMSALSSDASPRQSTRGLGRRQEAARRYAHRRHPRCKTDLVAPKRHTAPPQNSGTV